MSFIQKNLQKKLEAQGVTVIHGKAIDVSWRLTLPVRQVLSLSLSNEKQVSSSHHMDH